MCLHMLAFSVAGRSSLAIVAVPMWLDSRQFCEKKNATLGIYLLDYHTSKAMYDTQK